MYVWLALTVVNPYRPSLPLRCRPNRAIYRYHPIVGLSLIRLWLAFDPVVVRLKGMAELDAVRDERR